MASYRGTIRKSVVEGGVWQLHASDGQRYQLSGGDAGLRVDGQAVVIDGEVRGDAMGIGMTGPTLQVSSWKQA